MKNYAIYILTALFLMLSGCSEFLQEDTRGLLSPDGFFNNDEEAILAINGIYKTYRNVEQRPGFFNGIYGRFNLIYHHTVYGTDEVGLSRNRGETNPFENYSISEANYGTARGLWRSFYAIIGDANTIIENVKDNGNLSEEIKARVEGEAIYLRAFAYYHLTSIWGDVPYYTDVISLGDASTLGREDVSTIRTAMIADLGDIEARNLLPSVYTNSVDKGRSTIWTAKMLRAKFMLWEKDWQGVFEETTEIINNSPHRLLDNYGDVFERNFDPFNDEIIWGLDWINNNTANPTFALTQQVVDAFNPRLRDEPANSADRSDLGAALSANNEEFNGFGHLVCLPSFRNSFPEDDLRRPWSVADEYQGFPLRFAYLPKHWNLDFANSPRTLHGDMVIIFRLADVYLMAAEAANELGNTAEAYQYVNRVRERAYEPDQPWAGLSQQQFREALYDERKWELAGEGHRKYDLVRWGILVETIQNTERNVFTAEAQANIAPRHVKAPIPAEELELNPALLESDPTNNGYR